MVTLDSIPLEVVLDSNVALDSMPMELDSSPMEEVLDSRPLVIDLDPEEHAVLVIFVLAPYKVDTTVVL